MANSISAPSVSGIVQPAAGLAALRQQSTGGFASVAGILARNAEQSQAGQIGQYIQSLEGTQQRQHQLGLSDIIGKNQRSFADNATTLAGDPDVDTSTYKDFISPALPGSTPGDPISQIRDALERAKLGAGAAKDLGSAALSNAQAASEGGVEVSGISNADAGHGGTGFAFKGKGRSGETGQEATARLLGPTTPGDDGISRSVDTIEQILTMMAKQQHVTAGADASQVKVQLQPDGTYAMINSHGQIEKVLTAEQAQAAATQAGQ